MLDREGPQRARYLMLRLLERAGERRVSIPSLTSTDYVNTIPTENEPWFPGDEEVERRYRAWIRWNAAIMVHRAQRPGIGVGGHIRATPRRASTPAPSSRAGSPPTSSTGSVRSTATAGSATGCPRTRTRAC
ncbi:pyruvate dehydrogenase subunit E1 [Mycobacteroides abscessus subsp. abscessus]|nr:pyruvate dehydrogenase subunit E1 [Mycobacteroides abscessus subsp. abscessus]